ncbi:hypothetical protein [Halobacterium sp. CBA1126]|uniref:hypothetical protein n=1 Tax=Halobacterium TaxID=2239 RepID=UPI0012F7819D|nr:hypothetical protein [Halobacterium sp. CBA1126]MUV61901.1 hypothetical protein [Halobacterium sp. CBA1126]
MDCLRCGRTTDYERVAVDRFSGAVEGSLCTDCEANWLNGHGDATSISLVACFKCGDQPKFLFPQWDSIVESEDSAGAVETEYRIQLTTPGSCAECTEE